MCAFFFISIQLAVLGPFDSSADFMSAIRHVESRGRHDAVGDGGRAIGPYQIHYVYWKDSGVPGRYEQCRDRAYAERVMKAYWNRYCPKALEARDWQTLARVHNGGPNGHRQEATRDYWLKVRGAAVSAQRQNSRCAIRPAG